MLRHVSSTILAYITTDSVFHVHTSVRHMSARHARDEDIQDKSQCY